MASTMTRNEWNALVDEPMTNERYEALRGRYGFERPRNFAVYLFAEYTFEECGASNADLRINQLRALEIQRERERNAQAEVAAATRRRMAADEAAEAEQRSHDSGY